MRTIYVGSDTTPETLLRELLELADNPADVFWLVGENAVDVPDYLADRYFGSDEEEVNADQSATPKKRGRPRKVVEESSNGD
jgi:hypothetical protein